MPSSRFAHRPDQVRVWWLVLALVVLGPAAAPAEDGAARRPTYRQDREFLQQHNIRLIELTDNAQYAAVLVAPDLQGRVMTSTADGFDGPSFGWINREFIASGKRNDQFNPYGGEDRFWLGPEGSQFALYFKPGDPMDLDHWQVPAPLDREPWKVVEQNGRHQVRLQKRFKVTNYAGTTFDLEVDREIIIPAVLPSETLLLRSRQSGTHVMVYESRTRVTNRGDTAWEPDRGCPSIWILGMYPADRQTIAVLPYHAGSVEKRGRVVTTDYFGTLGPDRLAITDQAVLFRADGRYRSKIGIPPQRIGIPTIGAWDPINDMLTFVEFPRPIFRRDFVDSRWEINDTPYGGDVVHSYNDGGHNGTPSFYELESSSPALALKPGESYTHIHRTFHAHGAQEGHWALAKEFLHITLADIEKGLKTP